MYASLRLRSQETIAVVISLLEDMALVDPRGYRALTTPDPYSYTSTASTPSLRAREADFPKIEPIMPDADGGNVKVVVRVRKFIKRGMGGATN